jgi:hypothetical protein
MWVKKKKWKKNTQETQRNNRDLDTVTTRSSDVIVKFVRSPNTHDFVDHFIRIHRELSSTYLPNRDNGARQSRAPAIVCFPKLYWWFFSSTDTYLRTVNGYDDTTMASISHTTTTMEGFLKGIPPLLHHSTYLPHIDNIGGSRRIWYFFFLFPLLTIIYK